MSEVKNIVVLGASGSIGQQTLDVVRKHSDKLNIVGLATFSNRNKLEEAAQEFSVDKIVLINEEKDQAEANKKIEELICQDNVDLVVNAISGSAGLEAS